MSSIRPFLKYPGGKRRLLPQILQYIPETFTAYFEPFLGGGAVFLELASRALLTPGQVFLNDVCLPVVEAWNRVGSDPEDLISDLYRHRDGYEAHPHDYYYAQRAEPMTPDRFIFLNRTCFNGLVRFNRKGQFNVPMGTYTAPKIVDGPTIRRVSEFWTALRIESVCSVDFDPFLAAVPPGSFVYMDPPYVPLTSTSFTHYADKGFTMADQERLACTFERLAGLGAQLLMSNSNTEWVRDRYKAFRQEIVWADRPINRNKNGRGAVSELLIMT